MSIITETLVRELILSDLKSTGKGDVLSEFADLVATRYPKLKKPEIAEVLLEREKLGSTGIQEGIAIPHGKLTALDHILIAFGRSAKGIDFGSADNKLTHLFFVLLAPENETGMHLKILARLSRLLKSTGFREKLLKAKDAEEIYATLVEEDKKA